MASALFPRVLEQNNCNCAKLKHKKCDKYYFRDIQNNPHFSPCGGWGSLARNMHYHKNLINAAHPIIIVLSILISKANSVLL